MTNPTYKQILEEKIDAMDKELEALFNLAGLSFTAYISGKINEEERNALLNDWNEEAKVHYYTLASSIRSSVLAEEREKILNDLLTSTRIFPLLPNLDWTPIQTQENAKKKIKKYFEQRTTLDEMENDRLIEAVKGNHAK